MLNESPRHATSPNPSSSRPDARGAYNPITLQDVRPQSESPLFEGLESTSSRTLAGLLFAAIFVLGRGYLQFSGLLLLILLVCVLYRMDQRERQISAIPLAFSAIRIALGFTLQFPAGLQQSPGSPGSASAAFEAGIYWMPLLLSAYLFYSPWKSSHTSRLMFGYSIALLLAGLLPADGYLYLAATLFYTLFVAVGISLILDFSSSDKAAERNARFAPAKLAEPPQPAFS